MAYLSYPSPYGDMKPNEDKFRSQRVRSTSKSDYNSWESRIEGYSSTEWNKLTERFAEDSQFNLQRAMLVAGVRDYSWPRIFKAVYEGDTPFEDLYRSHFRGDLVLDWHYFAQQLALGEHRLYDTHFPPHYPEWLLPYGYRQPRYLKDLALYWDNIDDSYFAPWPDTIIGKDSPPIARLKKIGQEARREIGLVGEHAQSYLTVSQ